MGGKHRRTGETEGTASDLELIARVERGEFPDLGRQDLNAAHGAGLAADATQQRTRQYELTPLTADGYTELKDGLQRVIDAPEGTFMFVEDDHEALVRTIFDLMDDAQSDAEDVLPTNELGEAELSVVYRALYEVIDYHPWFENTVSVKMTQGQYLDLVERHGLATDQLAAFSGPSVPRVVASAAGTSLDLPLDRADIVGYLVVETAADLASIPLLDRSVSGAGLIDAMTEDH